jgi:TRAP-type C4-dicarboxylate transport system permease small subunit
MSPTGFWWQRLEAGLSGLLLLVSLLVVVLEVVSRQLLGTSFLWSEELSRYAMIWMTYFGMVAALAEDSHIRVDFLRDRFPAALRRWIDGMVLVACLTFSIFVVWYGARWVLDSHMLGMVSADSNIGAPIWVFQAIVPLAFSLLSLRILFRLSKLIRA